MITQMDSKFSKMCMNGNEKNKDHYFFKFCIILFTDQFLVIFVQFTKVNLILSLHDEYIKNFWLNKNHTHSYIQKALFYIYLIW